MTQGTSWTVTPNGQRLPTWWQQAAAVPRLHRRCLLRQLPHPLRSPQQPKLLHPEAVCSIPRSTSEYTPGNRTKFFQTIASLFNKENDMNTPTVSTLVVNMLKNMRKEHKEKSGVAEADTDLKQAMDAFLVSFDSVNDEVNAGQSQNAHDKHARRAEQDLTLMVRDKMLHGKRTADDGQSDVPDAEQITSNRPRKRSRRANAPIAIDIGMAPPRQTLLVRSTASQQ
ncbi:hypothetical protein V1505DRAFT_54066 [Lipomyces doorenjongii]